jgi:hypothetical protein
LLRRIFITAAALAFCAAAAGAEDAFYRIALVPSGNLVARDAPVVRGAMLVFHRVPDGNLVSIRRSDVRSVRRISAQDAAPPNPQTVIAIGNLAMQGGSPSSAATVRPAPANAPFAAPRWNGYDDWAVVPGVADAPPPASAVQVSPGAPPTLPP